MSPPTKRIHLVRHAQGFHNLSPDNHSLPDPLLTDFGKQQCASLLSSFPFVSSIDLIVASPLRRTLYTALLSFAPVIRDKNLVVVAMPELQETSDLPCDTGSDVAELRGEFGGAGYGVEFGLVEARPDWTSKKGDWAPWADPIAARARRARAWLRRREEEEIVVVSHGGFLHYLTEDFEGCDDYVGTGWDNVEFRTYTFDESRREYASLVETAESKRRRQRQRGLAGQDETGGAGEDEQISDTEKREMQAAEERGDDGKAGVARGPAEKSKV